MIHMLEEFEASLKTQQADEKKAAADYEAVLYCATLDYATLRYTAPRCNMLQCNVV